MAVAVVPERGVLVDESDHQADAPVSDWTPPTWEEVVRTHSARVYRLAYRLTGNVRCDTAIGTDLRIVPDTKEQAIGDTRRAARTTRNRTARRRCIRGSACA